MPGRETHNRAFLGNTRAEAERRAADYSAIIARSGYLAVEQAWNERIGRLTVRYALSPGFSPTAGPETTTGPRWSSSMPTTVSWPPGRAGTVRDAGAAAGDPGFGAGRWIPPPPRTHGRGLGLAAVAAVVVVGLVAGQLIEPAAFTLEPAGPGDPPVAQAPPSTRAPATSDDAGEVPRFEPGECRTEWLFGRDTECGDLIVLARRNRPDGPRLRIHVAIHRTFHPSPEPDPVVYLDGGPGGAPLVSGALKDPFLQNRDLIVIDPRGAGLSEPSLDCSEIDEARRFGRWDEPADLRTCRSRLIRNDVDLGAYNGAALAADVADLRRALAYDEWNLYGVSYGTRLALTVMRDHPDGLRSAVLDSVYPPQVDIVGETPRNAQRAFDRLFDTCADDPVCAAAYPGLEERFYSLVERLDREPQVAGEDLFERVTVDGVTLLYYLYDTLYVTELLGEIPMSIAAFEEGDFFDVELWIDSLDYGAPGAHVSGSSEGLYYSVQCADEMPFADPDLFGASEAGVRPEITEAFSGRFLAHNCDVWSVPAAPQIENKPVASDIPTLLLAGEYDPITPPAWAAAAAETLPDSWLYTINGAGHAVLGTGACVDGVVSRFLDDPAADPGSGCLDELGKPHFSTP